MPQSRLVIAASLLLLPPLCARTETVLNRGLAEAQQGDCQSAVPHLKQAASDSPPTASLFTALGVCQTLLGHPEQATASLEAVVRLDPNPWQGWNNLGGNYLALNRLGDAAVTFRQAIKRNPNASNAWFNLGSTLLASAESDPLSRSRAREQAVAGSSNPAPPSSPPRDEHQIEAFYALDKAQHLSPGDAQITRPWLELAGLLATRAADLVDEKQYQAAFALLTIVERPLAHSPSWNNLIGYTEFKLNNPDAAQRHLSSALRLDPDNEKLSSRYRRVLVLAPGLSASGRFPAGRRTAYARFSADSLRPRCHRVTRKSPRRSRFFA